MRRRLADRIREAMAGRESAPYHEVMAAVFPVMVYPNAWRRSTWGGPPGCAMAFGATVHRMGGFTGTPFDVGGRRVTVPRKELYYPAQQGGPE